MAGPGRLEEASETLVAQCYETRILLTAMAPHRHEWLDAFDSMKINKEYASSV